MSPPPSLLHLTLVTAVLHIHRFSDLSSVPDHLVVHLFQKTVAAGKLTDYVLRLFLATGNDEVLQLVKAWRIRPVIKPILPTSGDVMKVRDVQQMCKEYIPDVRRTPDDDSHLGLRLDRNLRGQFCFPILLLEMKEVEDLGMW